MDRHQRDFGPARVVDRRRGVDTSDTHHATHPGPQQKPERDRKMATKYDEMPTKALVTKGGPARRKEAQRRLDMHTSGKWNIRQSNLNLLADYLGVTGAAVTRTAVVTPGKAPKGKAAKAAAAKVAALKGAPSAAFTRKGTGVGGPEQTALRAKATLLRRGAYLAIENGHTDRDDNEYANLTYRAACVAMGTLPAKEMANA